MSSTQSLCLPSRGEGACKEFKGQIKERRVRPDLLSAASRPGPLGPMAEPSLSAPLRLPPPPMRARALKNLAHLHSSCPCLSVNPGCQLCRPTLSVTLKSFPQQKPQLCSGPGPSPPLERGKSLHHSTLPMDGSNGGKSSLCPTNNSNSNSHHVLRVPSQVFCVIQAYEGVGPIGNPLSKWEN